MLFKRTDFWLKLGLAIGFSYLMIAYLFEKPENECSMTFMMEPPKFLPVAVRNQSLSRSDGYKLYMYSEFGFPQTSALRRDLKNSIPVLFIPGNAGSYQQVRSLASTSIRRQMQSLEAFKFVFYTIDFNGELSAFKGDMIVRQRLFIHQSLKRILEMHSFDTDGVVIIGHSIGGFIAKSLFTLDNSVAESVPLLISLASPLKEPYIAFDHRTRAIYDETNRFWSSARPNSSIAISISGGRSDKLVPAHLTCDNTFDLSLTTSSIRDVWIAADHVSITWCRELMHKIAKLLSSLVDSKRNAIINDKPQALNIIKQQLLQSTFQSHNILDNGRTWKIKRRHRVMDLKKALTLSRYDLKNDELLVIYPGTRNQNLKLWIEHIEALESDNIFTCNKLQIDGDEISCDNRNDIVNLAYTLPSKRFGPKNSIIDIKNKYEAIILNFSRYRRDTKTDATTLPEMVTLQTVNHITSITMHIPTVFMHLFEDMAHKEYEIQSLDDTPIHEVRIELKDLMYDTQVYRIRYTSLECKANRAARLSSITMHQGNLVRHMYQVKVDSSGRQEAIIHIDKKSLCTSGECPGDLSLALYLDGNCEHKLKTEWRPSDLASSKVQTELSFLILIATFVTYRKLISNLNRLCLQVSGDKQEYGGSGGIILKSMQLLVLLYHYMKSRNMFDDLEILNLRNTISDDLISMNMSFVLATSFANYVEFLLERVVDVASILCRILKYTGLSLRRLDTSRQAETTRLVVACLIALASAGLVISPTLTLATGLMFLIVGCMNCATIYSNLAPPTQSGANNDCCSSPIGKSHECLEIVHSLQIDLSKLITLALFANAPSALADYSIYGLTTLFRTDSPSLTLEYLIEHSRHLTATIALLCIIYVKTVLDREMFRTPVIHPKPGKVDKACQTNDDANDLLLAQAKKSETKRLSLYRWCIRQSHIIALVPLGLMEQNIGHINSLLVICSMFVAAQLYVCIRSMAKPPPSVKAKH